MKKKSSNIDFHNEEYDDTIKRFFDNHAFEEESNYAVSVSSEDQPLVLKTEKPERNLFNLVLDAVLFLVEYLQMFALLQSLSLRWPWPIEWLRAFSFVFIFNIDVWEITKVYTPDAYVNARNFLVTSDDVPINYRVMLLMWLIVLVGLGILFFVFQRILDNRLNYNALYKLQTAFVISVQVLALPVGVQFGKLFWCRSVDSTLDVENSLACWSAEHIVYLAITVLLGFVLFLVYPVWLVLLIKKQVITSESRKHEMYMRLKHCEHLYGLNSSWNEQLYFVFASFRRFWIYHRPINHLIKFVIICFYAGAYSNRLVQIGFIFGILLIWLILSLIRLPYRVSSYNFPHAWNLACLASCAVIGTMQSIDDLQSVFLLPSYILGELLLINVAWLIGLLLWGLFVILRIKNVIWKRSPLWPALLREGRNGVTENTQKYITSCIKAKHVLEQANSVPALLSPVHLLSHQIKVLNALACEAEYIRDPLHSTLRDILDDVIQLHNKLVEVSIFNESVDAIGQTTSSRLLEMLPAFTKRVYQRDFDLILATSVRKRMLLKMFAVSCFMEAGRSRRTPAIRKLWKPSMDDMVFDEGFHEGDENVIALKNIKLSTRSSRQEDRPLSVKSSRKSEAAVLPVEESVA